MSGQAVEFHSALCVTDGRGREVSDIVTRCRFRVLPEQEIEAYLQREQPYDTAGSAKAEGLGIALMERSEEHTSELQSLMRISYAVFCLKKKKNKTDTEEN